MNSFRFGGGLTGMSKYVFHFSALVALLFSPGLLRAEDLIPPSTPSNLTGKAASCGQVTLSWSDSTDQGDSGLYAYVIQRWEGGSLSNQVTIRASRTAFSDTSHVAPSTALTYAVAAVDRAGNKSAPSNPLTVITAQCLGSSNEPPTGDFEGKLEISIEDRRDGKSHTSYLLNTARNQFSVRFAKQPPEYLRSGDHVHVRGRLLDGALAVDTEDASIETLALDPNGTSAAATGAAVVPNTFGAQKTLVMLVNFQDNPTLQPWTVDQVRNFVFGQVSNYFFENSYQQTSLTGDVFGWYTIPQNTSTCGELNLKSYAEQAAAAQGANLNSYDHYLYVFPNNACQFSGSSTVGGTPSKSMINGDFTLGVVAHELGHGLGLYHAHSYQQNGTSLEYGDSVDMMGASRSAHFSTFQKERLGWLNYGASPPLTTVQSSGTYALDPYESTGSNPKALKILKSLDPLTGKRTWYYVEYRQASGFDSYIADASSLELDSSNVLNGVLIHTGSADESGNTSFLLDMTPETYHLYSHDPALVVGKSFSDSSAGLTITTEWVNSFSAGVRVSFGGSACAHANPAVLVSPSMQSAPGGTAMTYTVSVTNNDANCSASTFNLQASVPGGWTSNFANPSLTVAPGTSASTMLTVTSPVSANPSSYAVGVTAANGAYSGSATATYAVVGGVTDTTPPTVSVTGPANGSIVPRNSAVALTAGAADDRGVVKVEFYVGNKLIAADANAPYAATWRVSGKANASYVIKAVAYDQAGNSASSTVSITAK
jgi:Bacterial Ig domain/NPCBM-associated, NEW3 domain of alpha-galactosidase